MGKEKKEKRVKEFFFNGFKELKGWKDIHVISKEKKGWKDIHVINKEKKGWKDERISTY